jgi:2-iminoacetate synthase
MIPSIDILSDFVRTIDVHASQRLTLLDRAGRVLAGREVASQEAREDLASALERWRYQHLNERGPTLAGEDRQLADTLDLTANRLAGRAERAPRAARLAIADPQFDPPGIGAAFECLDPRLPVAEAEARAETLTRRHFAARPGTNATRHRMLLYAPLYLSSHCVNYCVYCGFRYPLDVPRRHLTLDEAVRQSQVLERRGFRHILLVAGDFPRLTSTDYFSEILQTLRARGVVPSMEVAPQSTASYAELVRAGNCGVTLFQETYQATLYPQYHPRGTKASFDWRLEGIERAAEAGTRRLGLGVLLGLADPRDDLLAMMRHGEYLRRRFPQSTLAFNLPRIHEAPREFHIPHLVDDETFVRMYCALRVAFPEATLVLSTRELPELRNRLTRVAITQLSAGSSTAPGGYEEGDAQRACAPQFPVCDQRTVEEVHAWLQREGFDVAWDTVP